MKSLVLVVSGVVVAASVGGCASVSADAASDDRGIDVQKVSAIDNAARTRNLEVHWVHYPTRKTAAPSTVPVTNVPTGS